MSANGIFLDTGMDGLCSLSQEPYELEAVLQSLLEQYPELIAGPTTVAGEDVRLLLISREMAVPNEEGGTRTWSLDHLFVDTDAVPVFVEVKRSIDTRGRREVVAQMLDYAAHGVRYLPIQDLRDGLDRTAAKQGLPDGPALLATVGVTEPDAFWQTVATNLGTGRIRMLFVSDKLQTELRRIIEFLNEQMRTSEVLGVELRKFVGNGHTVYVPTVFGQTATAADAKGVSAGPAWDEISFLEVAETRCSATELALVRRLFEHIRIHGGELSGGRAQNPGLGGWYPAAGEARPVWRLYAKPTGAKFQFDMGSVRTAFGAARIEAMAARLESVPTMKGKLTGTFATLILRDIAGDQGQETAFFEALDVVVN